MVSPGLGAVISLDLGTQACLCPCAKARGMDSSAVYTRGMEEAVQQRAGSRACVSPARVPASRLPEEDQLLRGRPACRSAFFSASLLGLWASCPQDFPCHLEKLKAGPPKDLSKPIATSSSQELGEAPAGSQLWLSPLTTSALADLQLPRVSCHQQGMHRESK